MTDLTATSLRSLQLHALPGHLHFACSVVPRHKHHTAHLNTGKLLVEVASATSISFPSRIEALHGLCVSRLLRATDEVAPSASPWHWRSLACCIAPKSKTYSRRDSQMVTHSNTSRPVQCLYMAERTVSASLISAEPLWKSGIRVLT